METPPVNIDALAEIILAELQRVHPLKVPTRIVWRGFRTTAGVADYRTWSIGLSRTLMTDPERLRKTINHEYAHLLAVDRHGRKGVGHGEPWRRAMSDLGEPPEVRHDYECDRNRPRQVVEYACAKCGASIHRSRRFPRNRRYAHVDCGGAIKFVRVRAVTDPQSDS